MVWPVSSCLHLTDTWSDGQISSYPWPAVDKVEDKRLGVCSSIGGLRESLPSDQVCAPHPRFSTACP